MRQKKTVCLCLIASECAIKHLVCTFSFSFFTRLRSVFPLLAACKDHRKALEVSQHSEEMGLILGVCAGGLVVLILLLGAVIVIIKKG